MAINRRQMMNYVAKTSAFALFPKLSSAAISASKRKRRVVIIGGGFAGATAAKYIRMWASDIEVVLIEKQAQFISCPQSNLVLSGNRTIQQLSHDYHGLTQHHGVNVVQANAVGIDTDAKKVRLDDGSDVDYERLILAPGVDFIYDALPMMTTEVIAKKIPHAWKAGAQTTLLYQQLKAMRQGGKVVMTIPPTPYKCPPGPYERACQIALFLQQHNPTAKLIILDANSDIVSKKALFKGVWENQYSSLIDYYPSNAIETIDVKSLTVESVFDTIQADVLNVIPPQRAGKVAELADVISADQHWCEVDFLSYESTRVPHVHVIGDAVASTLPKSGHIANVQAKVCAAAVIALMHELRVEAEPVFGNTCYSFTDATMAGHVAAVFRYDKEEKKMAPMPGGGSTATPSQLDGNFADAWAKNIWSDILN
ncbi:MAG TPA: flavocytochrome C [Methylophaga aminisulfidivorans]|uniref:Flavocytochrome C n=2 Tax=root TaxID=1 RepID=A0A7C2AAF1_9GAMM|nr:flavocytochrome C [Methylophaga aminisulfidivorans]HEC73533.1 flavocytochrome C [Methylophaga aminisulfidivorans]